MKFQDNYEGKIAEQLAEVSLMRTGLVSVQKSMSQDCDLIAFRKDKPEEPILVEVKATTASENEILSKFEGLIRKLDANPSKHPYLIFFVNSEEQTGYFFLATSKNQRKLHRLRMDLLTNWTSCKPVFLDRYSGLYFGIKKMQKI